MSLSELARRSGLGKATLSQLETGQRNPTLDTLFALTTALQVPLGAVLAAAGPDSTPGAAVDAVLLDRCVDPATTTEVYRLAIRQAVQQSAPHAPGVVELLTVTQGQVRAGVRGEEVELGPGQSLRFAGDVPHSYQGLAAHSTGFLVMVYPATPAGPPG